MNKPNAPMTIEMLAAKYDMDAIKLDAWLHRVYDQYQVNKAEHDNYPQAKPLDRYSTKFRNKVDALRDVIDDAPDYLPGAVDASASDTDIMGHLSALADRVAAAVEHISIDPRNKGYHKDELVRGLAATWQELTGKDASLSDKRESFIEFMGNAVKAMHLGLAGSALGKRYKNLREKFPESPSD